MKDPVQRTKDVSKAPVPGRVERYLVWSKRLSLVALGFVPGLLISPFLFDVFPSIEAVSVGSHVQPPSYESRVELLSNEIERVREYEGELKTKVDALHTVVEKLSNKDHFTFPESLNGADGIGESADDGQGGGLEAQVPAHSHNGSLAVMERFLKKNEHSRLADQLDYYSELFEELPLGLPTSGRISSGYGMRNSPFTGRRRMHKGIDIASLTNGIVEATAPGKVKRAGYSAGYGKTVVVRHKNGLETLYGHLNDISVQAGDRVCRGQQIGQLGSTGRSTGPHLHYEVRVNGDAKNPRPFLEFPLYTVPMIETEEVIE